MSNYIEQLQEILDCEPNTINYHLKEIFKSEELIENAVIQEIRITASDGKKYNTKCYIRFLINYLETNCRIT